MMGTAAVGSSDGRPQRHEKASAWLADWRRPDGVDPLDILERVAEGRDRKLVKLRNREMAASAFSFLRGAAAVMSADLGPSLSQSSGIQPGICGDAHLANFGTYYSPERTLVFDVNDFDEARLGPWEWDLVRLATSVVVAAREYLSASKDVLAGLAGQTVVAYAEAIAHAAEIAPIDRCYSLTRIADRPDQGAADAAVRVRKDMRPLFANVAFRTQRETLARFIVDGGRGEAFVSTEATPVSDDVDEQVKAAFATYLTTVGTGRGRLLDGYSPSCIALRPVGEGSLGLKDYLLKLSGRRPGDGLLLQIKEATPSALDPELGSPGAVHEGQRVVTMEQRLQAVSDPLLGWTSIEDTPYYVRQFRDGKGAPDLMKMPLAAFAKYASLCGQTLAAAHARSASPLPEDVAPIAGYIGTGGERRAFIQGVATFACRYAKVTRSDMSALAKAIRVPAL